MGEPADEIEAWLGDALELRRVVVVGSEVRNSDGGRTIVSSVELWNTMMVVRWTVVAPDRLRHSVANEEPRVWQCQDDVGTAYQLIGGGGGGSERYWSGAAEFPRLPQTGHDGCL